MGIESDLIKLEDIIYNPGTHNPLESFTVPVHHVPVPDETISETFMREVETIRAQAYEWQVWALQEILYWKERCEELETELMLAENDIYPAERMYNDCINVKKRSNWK